MSWRSSALSNSRLIANLKSNGQFRSERVEKAMLAVDRKHFVPTTEDEVAYMDSPQPIGYGVTISAPHMHAMCLELLKDHLKYGCNALDVGSGSGYLLACMAHMILDNPSSTQHSDSAICGIEYYKELVEQSIENLKQSAITKQWLDEKRIEVISGDAWKGYPNKPNNYFHAIHVGAAAASVPKSLVNQLAFGGRMVIPVGPQGSYQSLVCIDKDMDGNLSEREICGVGYVPLVNPDRVK